MLDQMQLEASVAGIFEHSLHLIPPSHDTDLFMEGGLDSLLLVDLLLKLEQTFSIKVPLEELELDNFRSVTSIACFLGTCLREQPMAVRACR